MSQTQIQVLRLEGVNVKQVAEFFSQFKGQIVEVVVGEKNKCGFAVQDRVEEVYVLDNSVRVTLHTQALQIVLFEDAALVYKTNDRYTDTAYILGFPSITVELK